MRPNLKLLRLGLPLLSGALLRPPEPTRASSRKRSRVFTADVSAHLKVSGGEVRLTLTLAPSEIGAIDCEALQLYHKRSAGAQQQALKRRKHEKARAPRSPGLSCFTWGFTPKSVVN